MQLSIKHGQRYRTATRDEILSAASEFLISEARGNKLGSPSEAVEVARTLCAGYPYERFVCIWLDTRHRIITSEALFTGTIDGASVYVRTVAQRALELNAAAVIFAHNHPSGNTDPSESDRMITRKLSDALSMFDVRVLDHLVLSGTGHTSFAEHGFI